MAEIKYDIAEQKEWPTKEWSSSSPEEQGVSSDKLVQMIPYYLKEHQKNEEILIDSLTIIRNGHIISDLYFNPFFEKDKKHIINSCAKSIMGILIGIAIDKDFIKNIDIPIIHFFEGAITENVDDRLKSMTLRHLLTMRTGWHSQDSYLYQWSGLFRMQTTKDWTAHILNLPFETNPNTRFDYSNMASFLLSAIITKASGMDTFSFAKKYLFSPLGITDILWDKCPKEIYIGFARMWLKPHDMAKIGLLFLQKGRWAEQQIVSKLWVNKSISAHSFPRRYRYIYNEKGKINFGASGANWLFSNLIRPFTDGYGYQWWLDESGMFSAIGVGGQYIMVVPKEQLIVVATSKLKSKDTFFPVKLLKKFILPAIESNSPIPGNQISQDKLKSYTSPPPLQTTIKSAPIITQTAKNISGKNYVIEDSIHVNPSQYDNLRLEFGDDNHFAMFKYTGTNNETIQFDVGLDHQYRISEFKGKTYASKGEWINSNTFKIDMEVMGYSSKAQWLLAFDHSNIEVTEIGMTGKHNYSGKIKQLEDL